MRPLGSNWLASTPCAQTIASGAKARSAGTTTSSNAAA